MDGLSQIALQYFGNLEDYCWCDFQKFKNCSSMTQNMGFQNEGLVNLNIINEAPNTGAGPFCA